MKKEQNEGCTYTTDSHSRTSQGTKSRLSTWTRCFCLIATSSTELDVKSSNSKFLQTLQQPNNFAIND
uniref:Uncharacterized protein n=1 Tax=Rhizophora mucronata TaxID=61149 RepID=A0A2P2LKL1_RHIMU